MQVLLHLASPHSRGSKMMMHLTSAAIFKTLLNKVQWLNPGRSLQITASSEYLLRSNRTGFLLVNVNVQKVHAQTGYGVTAKFMRPRNRIFRHCKLQGRITHYFR